MAKYELAYVEWIDSHSYRGTWESIQDIVQHGRPSLVRSVGWIVSETNDWIVLVAHISNEDQPEADPFGFSDLSIPKLSISRLVRLGDVSHVIAEITANRTTRG